VESRSDPLNLAELDRTEIEAAFAERDVARFHGRQVFRWIHARGVTDFAQMTDLSQELRAKLAETLTVATPALETRQTSEDGTTKFLLKLADGRHIEAVYIPDTPAQTFCISTQVGCAMGCAFCLTGKMGLVRNLSAGEIAGQARVLAHATGLAGTPFNIVLMGMGEPLHNYDATMKALKMIADEQGLAVHPRRVTLSTVGLVPGIERLAAEPLMPNLAISLHATTEEQRGKIVPINRKYSLHDLIDACRRFPLAKRRRITFEYVLLNGVNDTPEDARRLATLLAGIKAKVNLLPLNEAPGIAFTRPADDRVNAFAKILADRDIIVSVRKSRGRDIRAACGQLIVEGEKVSAGQRAGRAL
jgi:23S rRNA (adenine2503-C2)-methyltransferase